MFAIETSYMLFITFKGFVVAMTVW